MLGRRLLHNVIIRKILWNLQRFVTFCCIFLCYRYFSQFYSGCNIIGNLYAHCYTVNDNVYEINWAMQKVHSNRRWVCLITVTVENTFWKLSLQLLPCNRPAAHRRRRCWLRWRIRHWCSWCWRGSGTPCSILIKKLEFYIKFKKNVNTFFIKY